MKTFIARIDPSDRKWFLVDLRGATMGRVAVRVIDRVTGEEIKCIPPEAMLDTLAGIRAAIGLLLDSNM